MFSARLTEKVNKTELEKVARSLSAIVVDHVNNKMVNQYEVSRNLMGMEITDVSQGVKGLRVFAFRSKAASESVTNPIWILCTQILDSLCPIWAQYFDNGIFKCHLWNGFTDIHLIKTVNRTYIST